jgi:hypothetical protein
MFADEALEMRLKKTVKLTNKGFVEELDVFQNIRVLRVNSG